MILQSRCMGPLLHCALELGARRNQSPGRWPVCIAVSSRVLGPSFVSPGQVPGRGVRRSLCAYSLVSKAVKAGVTSSVDSLVLSVGIVAAGAGQRVQAEIAAPFDPLVVLFGEDRSDEPNPGGAVGEDSNHIGCPADFLMEVLLRIVRPDLLEECGERANRSGRAASR